jgi:hypothetical protein
VKGESFFALAGWLRYAISLFCYLVHLDTCGTYLSYHRKPYVKEDFQWISAAR